MIDSDAAAARNDRPPADIIAQRRSSVVDRRPAKDNAARPGGRGRPSRLSDIIRLEMIYLSRPSAAGVGGLRYLATARDRRPSATKIASLLADNRMLDATRL